VLAGRSRDRKQAAADSDHRGRRGRGGAAERDRVAPRRAQEEEELGDRRSRHLREFSSRRRRQATNVAITVASTPKCASTIKALVVEPTAAVILCPPDPRQAAALWLVRNECLRSDWTGLPRPARFSDQVRCRI